MVKLGYNWDTGSVGFDFATKAMRDSGGSAHLVMIGNGDFFLRSGDIDTIRRVVQAVPNAVIIVRMYHRNEGNWSTYPSATEYEKHWLWVKTQLGAEIMKRVVFDDCTNEPNLAGDNAVAAKVYVTRCIGMVEAAARAGVKLAVGAWSVGTPHESLLGTVYLPLWQALAKHKQAISMHLYGAIPFEAGELAPLDVTLDPAQAHSVMHDTKWPITHGGWLIARAYRIIEIFRANGLGIPEIYATEGVVDNVYNSTNSAIKEQWRAKWGIDKFNRDPRGIQTYEKFIKAMYPTLSFDNAVAVLFDHARRNIFWHEAFKGVCLFALNRQWGYPSGTNKEAGSNYEDPQFANFRETYLPHLNSFVDTPIPPAPLPNPAPNPAIPMIEAKIRAKDVSGTNIRNAPVNGVILGKFENVWVEAKIQADYKEQTWVRVEAIINGTLIVGYSATAWLDVEETHEGRLYSVIVGDEVLLVTKESLEDIISYQEMLLAWLRKLSE